MKKNLLILALLLCSTANVYSQAAPVIIDSVKTLPAAPTGTDAVYLHIYGWCSYGAALNGTPTVISSGNNHSVSACYIVGPLAVITNIHDSVYVFTGPVGVHTVAWDISQNSASFSTACDTVIESGLQTVYVVISSLDQLSQNPITISWDEQNNSFVYSLPDNKTRIFSIYTMSGQLVRKEQTIGSSGKISLDAEAAGLYIVTLEDENGIVLRKKIYCQ